MYQLQTSKSYFNRLTSSESLPEFGITGPSFVSTSAGSKVARKQIPHAAYCTLDSLPVGVLLVDDFGNVEFANLTLASQLQMPQAELQGRPLSSIISAFRNIEDSELVAKHATARKNDGSTFTVEVTEGELELGGRYKRLLSIRRVSAQEEFARLHREFIAKIVHELKTPLASLTGVMSMLEDGILGQLNPLGSKTTARIKQTCKRMAKLVDEMLDLEKLEAGKFTLECEKIYLHSVLKGVIESALPIAGNRKITLSAARDLSCWADEDRLIQVVLNLLGNAIKNSADESRIAILAEKTDAGVKISVVDDGRGIPQDKLSKMFEAFEQVEVRDAKTGGTGLGLAICKAIVNEHGGEIGVSSRPGQGSCFWLTLPARQVALV